jgi:hypothetical protein
LFWRFGADKNRMRLTGLIDGKIDRYELGCIVDGYGVPPQDVLSALKTILGEPTGHTVKENNWIEFAWDASSDARHGSVMLSYNEDKRYHEGRLGQRVGLTLVQFLGTAAVKPQ